MIFDPEPVKDSDFQNTERNPMNDESKMADNDTEETGQEELEGVESEPAPEVEILDPETGSVRATLVNANLIFGKNKRISIMCSTVRRYDITNALTHMADATVKIVEPPRGIVRPVIEAYVHIKSITELPGPKKPRIKVKIEIDGLPEGAIDSINKLAQTDPADILLVPTQQELPQVEPTENG